MEREEERERNRERDRQKKITVTKKLHGQRFPTSFFDVNYSVGLIVMLQRPWPRLPQPKMHHVRSTGSVCIWYM